MAADAYARLAETLERLADVVAPKELLEVLDVEDLSARTGIPRKDVILLIEGKQVERTSVTDRVRRRLVFLRKTRRRGDGRSYSMQDFAEIVGVTRQTMTSWSTTGVPSIEAADQIRRHFDLPAGFMTADEPEALNEVLLAKLHELEAQNTPLPMPPELRRLALRSPEVAAKTMQLVAAWAMEITSTTDTDAADGSSAKGQP
ncbi:XRE family transcriptional regulator [Streptomyces sp. MC1]|uniref:XRE family transcriptional regulator n=1 Tax=Streptomyces sp. MC1 TaxID=295105 RepID=UPI0018CACBE6|nr:XRE family transcriptional regulator [Streptomyces sp. MC1]MBG7704886.1 XRE family transcriptional regulator [Streptomyces sp. MC1]